MASKPRRPLTIVVNLWFYRERATSAEPAADLHGKRLDIDWVRRNGVRTGLATTHRGQSDNADVTPSMLPELRRRRAAKIAQYRNEGRCSDPELRTIVALWEDGKTLRQHARDEGCSPQAIESRINGLCQKAAEFYRWWRLKNLSRHLRSRRS